MHAWFKKLKGEDKPTLDQKRIPNAQQCLKEEL
jgi:hypothetical protein